MFKNFIILSEKFNKIERYGDLFPLKTNKKYEHEIKEAKSLK